MILIEHPVTGKMENTIICDQPMNLFFVQVVTRKTKSAKAEGNRPSLIGEGDPNGD
jgi:hypothetical protein